MAFGVYGIFFPNKYVYVGSTIANFATRHRVHLHALKAGNHDNTMMQELYNKYKDCEFRTLEECENKDEVRELEQYFMEQLPKEGYTLCNETPALVEGNPLGEIVKKKISKARRGGRKEIKAYAQPAEPIKGVDDYHKRLYEMRKEQGW